MLFFFVLHFAECAAQILFLRRRVMLTVRPLSRRPPSHTWRGDVTAASQVAVFLAAYAIASVDAVASMKHRTVFNNCVC